MINAIVIVIAISQVSPRLSIRVSRVQTKGVQRRSEAYEGL